MFLYSQNYINLYREVDVKVTFDKYGSLLKILGALFFLFCVSWQSNAQSVEDWREQHDRAMDFYKQNQMDSSEKYFRSSLALAEKIFEESDANLEVEHYNLGFILKKNNKCEEAIPQLVRSIELYEEFIGVDSVGYVERLKHLSNCYVFVGDLSRASEGFEKVASRFKSPITRTSELNSGGASLARNEYYKSSIPLFLQARRISESNHLSLTDHYGNLAFCYGKLGELDSSYYYYEEALSKLKEYKGEDHVEYFKALLSYSESLYEHQEYVLAIPLLNQIVANANCDESQNIRYNYLMALCYQRMGQREAHLQALESVYELLTSPDNKGDRLIVADELYRSYKAYGDSMIEPSLKKVEYFKKSIEAQKVLTSDLGEKILALGFENNPDSANVLKAKNKVYKKYMLEKAKLNHNISSVHQELEEPEAAIPFAKEADFLYEMYSGKNSFDHLFSLLELENIYTSLNQFDTSYIYLKAAFEINPGDQVMAHDFLEDKQLLALRFLWFSKRRYELKTKKEITPVVDAIEQGNSTKALTFLLFSRMKSREEEKDSELLSMAILGEMKHRHGDMKTARQYYQLLEEELLLENDPLDMMLVHKILGSIDLVLNEYASALAHFESGYTFAISQYDSLHLNVVDLELDKVELYIKLARYDQAYLHIEKLWNSDISYQNLRAYLLMAQLMVTNGESEMSSEILSTILDITKGEESYKKLDASIRIVLLEALDDMGAFDFSFSNEFISPGERSEEEQKKYNTNGLNLANRVISTYEDFGESYAPAASKALIYKAYLLALNGEIDNAGSIYDEIWDRLERNFGAGHPFIAQQYQKLAYLQQNLGAFEDAEVNFIYANQLFREEMNSVFRISSEAYKKRYYKELKSEFDHLQKFGFQTEDFSDTILIEGLNNHLTFKALLLQQQKTIFSNLRSVDQERYNRSIEAYLKVKAEVGNLSLQDHIAIDELDVLISQRDSIEHWLIEEHVKQFPGNQIEIVDWKIIQKALGKNEVAVEFVNFKYDDHNVVYAAYIIRPDQNRPSIVYLVNEDHIKGNLQLNNELISLSRGVSGNAVSTRKPEQAPDLFHILWSPIEPEIKGAKKVYYSVSGLLNLVPYSAIKTESGELVCDKYELHQYFDLPKANKETYKKRDLVLMGGVDYNFAQDGTETNMPWTFLPGTKSEVEGISEIMAKSYEVSMYTGVKADETLFKSLDGDSPRVLHIATHGFYIPLKQQIVSDSMFSDLSFIEAAKFDDDPMLRSGLILANGNFAWNNGSNEHLPEDGILRASEIAAMDLSQTELVVLSACETGLGDIDGNEGVYGLQRAFRMAGVQNLVVSLWKVPDIETAEFMELLYTKVSKGSSYHESFMDTQSEMQKRYPNDMYKWAGFVFIE